MEIVISIIILAVSLIVFRFYGTNYFDRCYNNMKKNGKARLGVCSGHHYNEPHVIVKCFNCPYYISIELGDLYGKSTEKGTGESKKTGK